MRRTALGCLALWGVTAPCAANKVAPPRFADPERRAKLAAAAPELDRIFADYAKQVPGLSYGLIVDGELVHAKAFGVREVTAAAPVEVDSVFRIASMTKSFTALSILKLRDEGKLQLDDPVSRYVPELLTLAYPTQDSPKLTLRHLLSHSEGFPEDNPWGDRQLAVPDAQFSAMLRGGIPFSNAPGVAYEYSNYGFAILGRVVSRVSGMSRRDYVDRNILRPLGMTATRWEAASVPPQRVAKGYGRAGEAWTEETPLADGAFGAMGGLYSSVPDLARYVAFFLSAWPPRDDADAGPVRRASLREMQQAMRPYRATARRMSVDGDLVLSSGGYAFGLGASQSCRFAHVVAHSGGLPGYGSQMRWLPEYGVGIVALANRTYAGPGRAINDAFEALAKTGALQPRVVQPAPELVRARAAVDALIDAWDDGRANALAADNLFLDRSLAARQKDQAELRARHGACRPDGVIDAENALRGQWRLACERGALRVSVTLAPTQPPKVQSLSVVSIFPMGEKLAAAVQLVASQVGATPPDPLIPALAPGVDPGPIVRSLHTAALWGSCRVGDVQRGGGESQAAVRLACSRGDLDAVVTVDETSGRLKSVALTPSPESACVP